MKSTKTYLKRIRLELQELLGMLSVKELISNHKISANYELVHQQLLKWS